jgi:predicted ribosomally synthesized peptide with nif11-like leader
MMTTQALLEFRDKVNESRALQNEVLSAFTQEGEGVVGVGKKHGYSFTVEEAVELLGSTHSELSDFELELVSGGNTVDCGNSSGLRP